MKLLLFFPAIIIFAVTFTTCADNETGNKLSHAEAVIEDAPDSALTILRSIASPQQLGSKDKALYALLMSQAMYKSYITAPNDSLIAIACDYYDATDDKRHSMLSNFYRAGVLLEIGNYSDALYHALKAESLTHGLYDTLFMARANSLLADCYLNGYLFINERELRNKAKYYYKKADKKQNELWTTLQLLHSECSNKNYDRARELYDSLLSICPKETLNDSIFIDAVYQAAIEIESLAGDCKNIVTAYNNYKIKSVGYEISPNLLCYTAIAYFRMDSISKGKEIMDMIDASKLQGFYLNPYIICKAEYYRSIGDYTTAIDLHDTLYTNVNKQLGEILSQPLLRTQSEYFHNEANKAMLKADKSKENLLILGLITLAVLIVGIVVHLLYRKAQETRLQTHLLELSMLSDSFKQQSDNLNSANSENYKLRTELAQHINTESNLKQSLESSRHLLIDKLNMIDNLYKKYDSLSDLNRNTANIISQLNKQMNEFRSEEFKQEIIITVDSALNGYLSKLKEELQVSFDNLYLITLLYMGFSSKSISAILQLSLQGFYTKKNRIVRRIQSSNLPDKETVLSFMILK